MFCVDCGHQIENSSKFCSYCGSQQSSMQSTKIDDSLPMRDRINFNQLFLLLVALLLFALFNHKTDRNVKEASVAQESLPAEEMKNEGFPDISRMADEIANGLSKSQIPACQAIGESVRKIGRSPLPDPIKARQIHSMNIPEICIHTL